MCDPLCICGADKKGLQYQQTYQVMCFLKGLNGTFCTVGAQIILMHPIHERQLGGTETINLHENNISITNSTTKNRRFFGMAKRSLCIHYGLYGHVVAKSYEKDGFPPGYKPKNKPATTSVCILKIGCHLVPLGLLPLRFQFNTSNY